MSTREQLLMVFDSLSEASQTEALRLVTHLQAEHPGYEQQVQNLIKERLAEYEANPGQGRPSEEVEAELLGRDTPYLAWERRELTRRTQDAEADIAAGNGLDEAQVNAHFDQFWAEG